MTNRELRQAVQTAKDETRVALQTLYDTLNPGQRKQLIRKDAVKVLFDLYGVQY